MVAGGILGIPYLGIIGAIAGLLFLMTRKGITWKNQGIWWGIGLAVGVGLLLGWYLDAKAGFSILLKWGLAGSAANGGTTLFLGMALFTIGLLMDVVGMAASAIKSGNFVS